MLRRCTARLAALLALALPAAMLQAAPAAHTAAPSVLYAQTAGAAAPQPDESQLNFAPSNHFEDAQTDQAADDFTVPAGAAWSISEIAVTGAFNGDPGTGSVNVFLYKDNAGKPGAQVFAGTGIAATGGPSFVVPLTGAPTLKAGTYWVSVQYNVGEGSYWVWGTTGVQRGSAAQWRTSTNFDDCDSGAWWPRATCFPGNPDQVFTLKGTNVADKVTLGKVVRNTTKGTARLTVTVPTAGEVVLKGKGVARKTKKVKAPKKLRLAVKATGAAKRTLEETGKVTVKVKVTYTPSGGAATTVTKKVTLKKKV